MKLLFDHNLSPSLCRALSDLFPDSNHVREAGMKEAEDAQIWDFAAREGFAIVTKDGDFRQRSLLFGFPPKIVWLKVGNCSTKAIEALPRSRVAEIEDFLRDEAKSFLVLS